GGGWIRLYFFFSSRRRHTRFSRDWSSDVCSSDLLFNISTGIATLTNVTIVGNSPDAVTINTGTVNLNNSLVFGTVSGTYTAQYRSEERRVGKECRAS